MPPVFGGKFDF